MNLRTHKALPYAHPLRRAFTLIEVVTAIAIFGLTASILLSAIGNAYFAQDSLLKRDTKHQDRREILRTILDISQSDNSRLDSGGDYVTSSGENIRWNAVAEETTQAGLFKLIVEIDWGGDDGTEELVFFTFRPAWKTQFNNQDALLEDMREEFPSDRFDTY